MKPLVIYHDNCADGFASAYVAWRQFGDDAEYLPASYPNNENCPIGKCKDRNVYVLDFSYTPTLMAMMCEEARAVVWLDHHKKAIDAWEEYRQEHGAPSNMVIHLDVNLSGCGLAWEHFFPSEPLPLFLARIQDRDLWQFEIDDSQELHAILGAHEYSFEFWHSLCNDHARQNRVIRQGVAILMQQTRHIQTMIDQHQQSITMIGRRGVALNCPPMWASEAGNMMMSQNIADFACTWFEKKDGSRQFSLRSNDQCADVGEIAKKMGGGGHRNAAGFVLSAGELP